MSIINDALKKAQMSFKKPKSKDKQPDDTSQPAKKEDNITNVYEKLYKSNEEKTKAASSGGVVKEKKSGRKPEIVKGIFAFLFLVASLTFTWKFLSGYEPLQDFISSKTGMTRSSRHFIQKHMTAAKKRTYKDGEYVLNGISDIDGQRVALINDEIYQVGESIGDKEIVRIRKDEVEIRDGAEIITLQVR